MDVCLVFNKILEIVQIVDINVNYMVILESLYKKLMNDYFNKILTIIPKIKNSKEKNNLYNLNLIIFWDNIQNTKIWFKITIIN